MKLQTQQVIIANGESVSNAVNMSELTLRAIITPSAWTAADIAFLISDAEAGTYVPFYDWDGVLWACTATASDGITPRQEVGEALPWVKLSSVSAADNTVAVNQGAARTLTLLCSPRQV